MSLLGFVGMMRNLSKKVSHSRANRGNFYAVSSQKEVEIYYQAKERKKAEGFPRLFTYYLFVSS